MLPFCFGIKMRYTFLLCLTISSLAFTQGKIIGLILDAKTKDVVVGASVQVLESKRGMVTGLEGKFQFDNLDAGTYRLQISALSYAPLIKTDIIVTNNKPVFVSIELEPDAIQGEEIVVTAGYFAEANKTQTSTTNLSREEIRRFPGGGEDVIQTVATLPGVAVRGSGGRNDLLVRGGGPSENIYVVNGMEAPNINHFSTQGASGGALSFVNLDFVDNVSFSSGGFAARYGDKMSSVTNLTTRPGRTDRIGGKALISASQYGANVEGPLGKNGDFIVSARRSYLDLLFKALGLGFIPNYTDFNILGNYEITPKDRIRILSLVAIDYVEKNNDKRENRIFNSTLLDNEQYISISGINYVRTQPNGYWDITANTNVTAYRFAQSDTNLVKYFSSDSREIEYVAKVQRYWILNKGLGLLTGFDNKWIHTKNNTQFGSTIIDREGNSIPIDSLGIAPQTKNSPSFRKFSAFTEADWVITKKIEFNLGVRLDHFSYLDRRNYIAPRVTAKYSFTEKWNSKLSIGRYYQSPSYVWVANPANRALKALANDMLIGGSDYTIKPDTKIGVEAYYKRYRDLPSGTTRGVDDYFVTTATGTGFGGREDNFASFGYATLKSSGSGRAFGLEILLQKKFSDTPYYGQMSVTIGKSELTAANGKSYPNPFDQRFILNIGGGYKFNNRWEVSGKFRYFTGSPYTPTYRPSDNPKNTTTTQNLPDEYLSKRLPAGHHLDLRVDRFFNYNQWRLIVFADVQNVYGYKQYTIPSYDFSKDQVNKREELGIFPSIGISAEF